MANSTSSSGLTFPGALFLLFLGLKLTGHITWSWWWVTSPLWISFIVGAIFLTLFLLFIKKL